MDPATMEQRSGTVPNGPVTRREPFYCTATLSLADGQVKVTEKVSPANLKLVDFGEEF